tara:strand:- start:6 stop:1529 length:1524 start_codon:yes stop_codon:yes gene_type:complete
MPDTSLLSPFIVRLGGGLVLDKDTFSIPSGAALQLQNFEPDIKGGYRRLNGFSKFNTNIVPQTSASTEKVLGVHIYKDLVIAARGEKVFKGGSTGSWTEIDTGRTSAGRYNFVNFNFDGTDKMIMVDGANLASVFNNTSVSDVSASGRPADPQFVEIFRSHAFYAGMSASPQELIFSVPFDEDNFTTSSGAGSIKVDGVIKGIKVFRENLFVFCEDSIFKIAGSSSSDFAVVPVTRKIGCIDGFSIQEISGDIVYLAPDGLRTIAGTERIGDVELGTISKQVQPRLDNVPTDRISSLVIRKKSQYRLFFPTDDQAVSAASGVIGVIKAGVEGGVGWEYSDVIGVKPSCCASGFISGVETIIHGSYDGYVQKQETGNTFDGTNIQSIYQGPDFTMGDAGIRKMMQRIIWNYDNEGNVDADFRIRYDFSSSAIPQPSQYPLTTGAAIAIYGNPASLYATAVYGSSGTPLVRQSIEGSGFTVSVRLDDKDGASPISIKGYQLEFTPGGRR